jgi:hypothetical protein
MFTPILLAGLAAWSLAPPPTDLAAIPRTIEKEPAYQGKPRYCLLVFGKQADTRIWMVHDGKHFYVDRNGNGDLTDAGEKVAAAGAHQFYGYKIVERDGKTPHTMTVICHNDGTLHMELHGNRRQYVGIDLMERPSWSDKPETAPVIHFGGPMSFERYGPIYTIPRKEGRGIRYSLRVMLGTPGIGKGTFASYDEVCTEELGPLQADIVYSHKNGEMFEQRVELKHDG